MPASTDMLTNERQIWTVWCECTDIYVYYNKCLQFWLRSCMVTYDNVYNHPCPSHVVLSNTHGQHLVPRHWQITSINLLKLLVYQPIMLYQHYQEIFLLCQWLYAQLMSLAHEQEMTALSYYYSVKRLWAGAHMLPQCFSSIVRLGFQLDW